MVGCAGEVFLARLCASAHAPLDVHFTFLLSALVLLGQSSLADVPKGSEDKQLIVDAFRSRPVFGGLDEDVLKRAADVMYERSSHRDGH